MANYLTKLQLWIKSFVIEENLNIVTNEHCFLNLMYLARFIVVHYIYLLY